MIEFKNVSYTYPNGHKALQNVDLKINDGEFAFIVGSSGAGKSTLIKLMLRELQVTDGEINVNGYNLKTLKSRKVSNLRRTIGVVFQDFRLIPNLTVYENVAFALRVIDAPMKYIRSRVPYVLTLVGLGGKAKCYPSDLSGGEQQRVALARALVNDPQLIIADEPTGNVDPARSFEIVDLLKAINACGTTVVMVNHQHELVRYFGGRIINVNTGSVVFDEVIGGADEAQ
ncbi:MAG: cell division ATP-binding protein FtsE [Oscillospiraceae bacterium]|nr:cell division ATP-binding protein FtsE [Oscillospiraceae bacterium]